MPLIATALWLPLIGVKVAASDVVTLGVTPTSGPVAMERSFGRLVAVLDEAIPQTVVFRTRASHEQFLTALNDREFVIHPVTFFIVERAGKL